jgi:hypothetical protein
MGQEEISRCILFDPSTAERCAMYHREFDIGDIH